MKNDLLVFEDYIYCSLLRQERKTRCKPKMIMSPFSKVEMTPLVTLKVKEVLYEGDVENDVERSRAP